MDIQNYLHKRIEIINAYLENHIPLDNQYPAEIYRAMRYSVFAGGKRIRPILTLATAELLNGNIQRVLPVACAIELIHTYSLIHDDLPYMDNDDYRRGKLTCHKQFGEAIAILAGNALLMLAMQFITNSQSKAKLDSRLQTRILKELTVASGFAGMVGGQIVDTESENKSVDFDTVYYIHTHKTGALLCSSIRIGAILSNANKSQLQRLTRFGNALGLMFQITDDILDEMDNRFQLQKIGKRDRIRGKATFPSVIGIEKSKDTVAQLYTDCQNIMHPFGKKAEALVAIAELVAKRIE
ncbi:MAG: polyprenyl synthetase family protein [bacterium]|nr:polyprenyl synthetase family protein [bacterium]